MKKTFKKKFVSVCLLNIKNNMMNEYIIKKLNGSVQEKLCIMKQEIATYYNFSGAVKILLPMKYAERLTYL